MNLYDDKFESFACFACILKYKIDRYESGRFVQHHVCNICRNTQYGDFNWLYPCNLPATFNLLSEQENRLLAV